MTYFLGCDVSKRKLDLCLVDELGAQVWLDQIPNVEDDIAAFLLAVSGDHPDTACVVEATGCYHLPFAETAYALGLACKTYNPILTKQQIRTSIRGKKTDRTDALIIARLGLRGEGRLYMPEPYSLTKLYARGQQRLSQFAGAVDIYQTHIEDLLGQRLSLETGAALDEVRAAFKRAKLRFSRDMTSSAPTELCRRLQSIPGVGPYIAASIIGEIQDMGRFRTSKLWNA